MILKTASLTPEILKVVRDKGTEPPFSGEYNDFDQSGSYLCRQCGLALFRANSKFHSGCGWPAFDAEISAAITRCPDADGQRIEVLCRRCQAHLGHVFSGERFTPKNTRHCINSFSLDFVTDVNINDTEEAIFAGGCFWGVEFYLNQLPGVVKTEVGYMGGDKSYPDYEAICRGDTGHVEAVRVLYHPEILSYEQLTRYFFEIHDPSQQYGQGPDIGTQYLSKIFYYDAAQKLVAEALIKRLTEQGVPVATQLLPVAIFWRAENYHQHYYQKTGKQPYCHFYLKRFND